MTDKMDRRCCVSFVIAKQVFKAGVEVPCTFRCHDYFPKRTDRIGIFRSDDIDEKNSYSSILAADALTMEDDTYVLLLEGSLLTCPGQYNYEFRYINGNKEVIGRSLQFKFSPASSDDKFLTVREISSYDDTTLLVNKLSVTSLNRLEEENLGLRDELVTMKQKVKEKDVQIKDLTKEKDRALADLKVGREKETSLRLDYEEISKQVVDQMATIQQQITTIEELERKVKRDETIKHALDEEVENQRSLFESGQAEVEDSKALAAKYKVEYRKALEKLEEDRLLYEETIVKLEEELISARKTWEQTIIDPDGEIQDVKEKLTLMEDRYQEKLKECLILEEENVRLDSSLKKAKEDLATTERNLLVKLEETNNKCDTETEKLQVLKTASDECLSPEKSTEKNKSKEELQNKLLALEKENAKQKEDLERKEKRWIGTEKKIEEMEELVCESKKSLLQLEKAVDATPGCMETQHRSSQTETKKKVDTATAPREYEGKEMRKRDNVRGNKRRTYTKMDRQVYGRGSNRKGERGNNEEYGHRRGERGNNEEYGHRRGERGNNEEYGHRRRGQNIASMERGTLEKQFYLVRQHRNSLLRYNSRLRHSVGMLNHDCAILQYNLQQILADSEHRIASYQALYYKKDSECVMLEAQLQSFLSQTDVYCQSDKMCDEGYTLSFTPGGQMGHIFESYSNGVSPAFISGGAYITPMYQDGCTEVLTQSEMSQEPEHQPVIIEMTQQQNDEESAADSPDEQENTGKSVFNE